jgi:uncharacterized protein DUF1569
MTAVDGRHFDEQMAELDRAVSEVIAVAEEPKRWARGRPGKWTAGQHAAHLVISQDATADAFERRVPEVLNGAIPPVPRRGPVQWLWVSWLVKGGTMPGGIRTPRPFEPAASPDRGATLDRLRRGVARHRAVGHILTAAQRDRLWIRNPFLQRWHYRLVEMVCVHAVHARHHLALMRRF